MKNIRALFNLPTFADPEQDHTAQLLNRLVWLKYGKIGEEHAGENLPHLHREDKSRLYLTEEMSFQDFVDWVKGNL